MNVSNDNTAINYIDYFTVQFPKDLAAMAQMRDELALRQGSITAAKDAVVDRQKAAGEFVVARTEADKIGRAHV